MDSSIFNHPGIFQKAFASAESIPFSDEVRKLCQGNMCGRYGMTWSCPPATGEPEELKKKALSFKNAFVFTHTGEVSGYNNLMELNRLRDETTDILSDLCEKLKENNIPFDALGCGSCNICKKCTYPHEPCRFPEKVFPPVEAYGINVVKLAEDLKLSYKNGKNTVTFFCIIFF